MNNAKIEEDLVFYVIHSDNAELIHNIEENYEKTDTISYYELLFESIKCNHNNIANYIQNVYLYGNSSQTNEQAEIGKNEELIKNIMHYHNYELLPDDFDQKLFFYNACKYDYFHFVEYFLGENILTYKDSIDKIFFYIQN